MINICLIGCSKTHIILKDKKNKIFEGNTDNYGKIKIPIINNKAYKLIIKTQNKILIIPILAKTNHKYCIPVNITKKQNEITIYLKDYNYPEILIKKGEIHLWGEDTLSI